jgi:hypothetical protein
MALDSPQFATGSLADLGYVEEASYGKVPPTPALKVVRRRSTSLGLTKESYRSEEVRSDRMTSDLRHGVRQANGDIVTEISPGGHSDFYEAELGGIWSTVATVNVATGQSPVTITNLGDGTLQFAGPNFTTSVFMIGDTMTFASTTNAYLDGKVFTLVGINGSNQGIVVPWTGFFPLVDAGTITFPIVTTAGTLGLSGKRCAMGNVKRSFTMERAFTDIGRFQSFTGERFNTVAVDLPTTGIATATFGVMGKDARPMTSTSIDGSAAVVSTNSTHTSLTFDAAAGTITGAAGSFITAGFAVGDQVSFDGAGITDVQNRNIKTITALTATVMTVAEAIVSGGPYTSPFSITKVGATAWTAPAANSVSVSASGILTIGGVPAGTVQSMSFSIDNQMAGATVVGSNFMPSVTWGNQATITGQMTVLFDLAGIGNTVWNAFDQEGELTIIMRLDSADGTKAVTFAFPRVKLSEGSLGDAEPHIPVSVGFEALRPGGGKLGVSAIVIGDTAA